MPLIIDGQVPPRWAATNSRFAGSATNGPINSVKIAFVNNMPDSALEDTEIQFFELLDAAAGDVPVVLSLYSLSGVPRGERGQQHVNAFYRGTNELLSGRVDGLIMTGTEPRQPNLRNESYWSPLTSVLDWAENETASTILSCLAAHAGVLHSDGIERHPLSDKRFGVFEFTNKADHQLTIGAGEHIRFPHSRWNEVQAHELGACGYMVLTQSAEGGVDSFVKKKKRSLFVHFQGHPEYGAQTLMKEYRRDIRRFLRNERETYPSMPKGYFNSPTAKLMTKFRDAALSERREDLMEGFPENSIAETLQKTWQSSATAIYRNWLQYVVSKKSNMPEFSAAAVTHENVERKRAALR